MSVRPSLNSVQNTAPWGLPGELPSPEHKLYVGSFVNKSVSKSYVLPRLTGTSYLKQIEHPQPGTSSLQHSFGRTFFIAQCFGLFPLQGILGDSVSSLRFSWLSFRILYSCVAFVGMSFMSLTTLVRVSKSGISFNNAGDIIFNVCTMMTVLLFTKLAYQWRTLAEHWAGVELDMGPPSGPALKTTINRISAVVLGFSLMEYSLFTFSDVMQTLKCSKMENSLDTYFRHYFKEYLYLTDYALWKSILLMYFNVLATFAWNFTDLFIIIVSVALTHRFKQINYKLNAVRGKVMPEGFWRSAREEFVRLTDLLAAVDDVIGHMIMLSFTNNLWFICAQLLKSLSRVSRDTLQAVYFWYSFWFLLLRTVAMCLYAAHIPDESRGPLNVLRAVPSLGYNMEVQRYIDHAANEVIGLTGMKFFTITRGVVLSVAGTIVTYELVLVQFDNIGESANGGCP